MPQAMDALVGGHRGTTRRNKVIPLASVGPPDESARHVGRMRSWPRRISG